MVVYEIVVEAMLNVGWLTACHNEKIYGGESLILRTITDGCQGRVGHASTHQLPVFCINRRAWKGCTNREDRQHKVPALVYQAHQSICQPVLPSSQHGLSALLCACGTCGGRM